MLVRSTIRKRSGRVHGWEEEVRVIGEVMEEC